MRAGHWKWKNGHVFLSKHLSTIPFKYPGIHSPRPNEKELPQSQNYKTGKRRPTRPLPRNHRKMSQRHSSGFLISDHSVIFTRNRTQNLAPLGATWCRRVSNKIQEGRLGDNVLDKFPANSSPTVSMSSEILLSVQGT